MMKFGPDWKRERRIWRARADRDVDDELAFHLSMRAELLQNGGLDPQTARDAALQRFGDLDEIREHCVTISHERERHVKRREIWFALRQHVRHALRRLRAAPAFTASVTLMLALGIGATTAVFSVVEGVLLRPLPFDHPERLVSLSHTIAISGISTVDQSDGTFLLYQRHATRSFENMGAYRLRDVNLGASSGAAPAERVSAARVSASLFPTLRAVPEIGRSFTVDDDRTGARPVVIVSAQFWEHKLGRDPRAIGKSLTIDGLQREIIGVMPERFQFPEPSVAVWLPLALDPLSGNPASFNYFGVARLRDGVSTAAATAELATYLPRLLDEFPADIPREMWAQARVTPVVRPLHDVVIGDTARLLWMLLAAAGVLLAISCANAASLFLVRAEGAKRDVAIRVALGAGKSAVVVQYAVEAMLLATGGALLGILLARWGIDALRASPHGSDLPRVGEIAVDGTMLLFSAGIAVLCALAVNLLPLLRARHVSPGLVLKESNRTATTGRERQRARSALVVAQVALALVLVSASTLMARSFLHLRDVHPGFDASGVLTVRVALPRASYAEDVARLRLISSVLGQAKAMPGVTAAAATEWLPLSDDHNDSVIILEDHAAVANATPPDHPLSQVTPEHFSALGIPLLRGRTFTAPDPARPSTEAIVSQGFAQRYWKDENPIGKRLRNSPNGPWFTIVGVVGDVHMESLDKPAEQFVYFPIYMDYEREPVVPSSFGITLRTQGDPSALMAPVRAAFRAADPGVALYGERLLSQRLSDASARMRFIMLMLAVSSSVALVIGMVGLYGVLSYGVTLRRREIGVRMALGASSGDVVRMIARHGIALAGAGVAVGLAGAIAGTRLLRGLLYGVSPTDTATLAGTCILLLVVATVASWLPARRAASIDPMEALRRD